VVATITRSTLTSCMAHQVSLMDAMCKVLLPPASSQHPIYANNSKTGSFMIYDRGNQGNQGNQNEKYDDANANADANAHDDDDDNARDAKSPACTSTASASIYEWQTLTPKLFQWMINAVHRQLLSEYHTWTMEANDNSDEFIETSMRFGAIILGGNMEWPNFMAKLNSRLWTLMIEKQARID